MEAGTVEVDELTLEDWQRLPSWATLRPLELRRLTATLTHSSAKAEH